LKTLKTSGSVSLRENKIGHLAFLCLVKMLYHLKVWKWLAKMELRFLPHRCPHFKKLYHAIESN
jgi:hypothetical protein